MERHLSFPLQKLWKRFTADVRIPFSGLLMLYVILGMTVLGFNRSPWQASLTVACSMGFDYLFGALFKSGKNRFPWSGLITGLGLCLLLNYGSNPWLPAIPAFLAIASKYVITIGGRHFYNPALFGLIVGLWLTEGMISPAPAYQWGGSLALTLFLVGVAFMVFLFRVGKAPLVLGFLGFYSLQMALRAWIIRHHLPPETIFLSTLTSAPFFLFTFYMLTDPKTSPKSVVGQLSLAFTVTLADLYFHTRQSYSTLFPALFYIQTGIFFYHFIGSIINRSGELILPLRRVALIGLPAALLWAGYSWQQQRPEPRAGFSLTKIESAKSGIDSEMGNVLQEVDSRIQHIAKWILSVGDAVATGDIDNDGKLDIFLTNPLKKPSDRCSLYQNLGDLKFARIPIECLDELRLHPETHGLPSCAVFADYDNDGDQDLFLGMGFGPSKLLSNRLIESGVLRFEDVTEKAGLSGSTTCLASLFCDFDQDGDLDLLVGNSMAPYLPNYDKPTKLDVYKLPEPEYEGDQRMFHFMHSSWHKAENGGMNVYYRNTGSGKYERENIAEIGMPETHWTLAVNAADFDHDGWPDIYAASDFGPDDLYFNDQSGSFKRHQGKVFGSIGNDTFKGMNCSLADFDRNGFIDIYVSNVHAPLQAEGSLLWMIGPDKKGSRPTIINQAVRRSALNENRFGWGAAAGDVNGDGWIDLVQANGMVDDKLDRRFDSPRDYWYANGQIARTGPEVHSYANKWSDIRGYTIFGQQSNRILLNNKSGKFADVASSVGFGEKGNSRGIALADFDNDGDLDILVTHQFKTAELFRNDRPPTNSWIGLRMIGNGKTVNRDAVNSKVEVRCGDNLVYTEVMNVTGFSAQGDRRIYVGLNDVESKTANVVVTWRSNVVTHHSQLSTGRYHDIIQSSP